MEKEGNGILVAILMEDARFGGPARNLLGTLRRLRGRVTPRLITFVRGRGRTSEFVLRFQEAGIEVTAIEERFRYDPECCLALGRCLRRMRPDILQVHNTKSRLYVTLLSSLFPAIRRIPRIFCFHGETWIDRKQRAYNRLDRLLFRWAGHVLVVSESQRRLLEGWGVRKGRIAVVHNGVDVPDTARTLSAGSRMTILSIGRLSQEKGHLLLLQAFATARPLMERNPRLIVVGEGPDEVCLKQYVKDNGLADAVEFAGYRPDVESFYREADLLVLPSHTEGLPNVLLEAMAYGVPIVATDVGGVREVIRPEREGVLTPAGDASGLSRAMVACSRNPERFGEMADRARERVRKEFSLEAKAEKVAAYYAAVMGVS